jgi:DNA-binding MarR family transcriptional regulator
MTQPEGRVQWLTDLIRLEILLWDQIDARLKHEHGLPLAFFETLYMISRSNGTSLRIGDLAQRLRITVGGTSKLADRIQTAGLIRREPDLADRRASRVTLTAAGRHKLAAAVQTYNADLAATLDAVLSETEQRLMHELVTRLLAATKDDPSDEPPRTRTGMPKTRPAPDGVPLAEAATTSRPLSPPGMSPRPKSTSTAR